MLVAASLELKAESAHQGCIAVDFSPDGTTIVSSGSYDKTINVWDAVNFRPHVESEWEQFWDSGEVEDEVEDGWRNKVTGHEQATKPSGGAPLGH